MLYEQVAMVTEIEHATIDCQHHPLILYMIATLWHPFPHQREDWRHVVVAVYGCIKCEPKVLVEKPMKMKN